MYFPITVMPTQKRRLNITLKKDVAFYIKKMALHDDVPESTKAAELIENAIEFDEDLYWSRIAEESEKKTKKWISHKEFWSKIL